MAPPIRTFMDVSVGDAPPNRVIFELFVNQVPKTVENFRALCTGEKGISRLSQQALHYKGSIIHRVIPGFMAQGGDFTKRNGTGGESIYGGTFADEDLSIPVDKEGLLVMANRGPDTNGSQFFITFAPAPHLNGKHCVFGKVVRGTERTDKRLWKIQITNSSATLIGLEHVQAIEKVQVDDRDRPLSPVTIINCGELVLAKKAVESSAEVEKSRRSASPSSARSRSASPSRKRRSSISSDSGSDSNSEEDRRRRKRKEKKSKKKDKKDKDGKKDKLKGLVAGYEETEEELDARLEREEKERIEAAKQEKLERIKRQLAEQSASQSGTAGVVIKGKDSTPFLLCTRNLIFFRLGRGAMKYRDPERGGGAGDSHRDFGRPRAYDGVPRPERRYQPRHNDRRDERRDGWGGAGNGHDDRHNRDRGGPAATRDALDRYPSRSDADDERRRNARGDAAEGDWNAARKRTQEGRNGSRSPVRFTKATERSPTPPAAAAAPPKRSVSPVPQTRRGEMLTDSEEEMDLDQD
ncbi:hypothetical protein QFC19_008676 [Naganishia cerealis]|uniref:Uncharacterized protein n=1 Tax=Naganishia cerealis TaxID=610337 RepID=A0ACC2V0M6_9TREE|nr:hypothetical protein QFC19_008676 [Naganishia cerealis]